jgi:hypothetical protein
MKRTSCTAPNTVVEGDHSPALGQITHISPTMKLDPPSQNPEVQVQPASAARLRAAYLGLTS